MIIFDTNKCNIREHQRDGARTIDQKTTDRKRKLGQKIENSIIQVAYWPMRLERSFIIKHIACSIVIFCSVVIDSYQVPRAAKTWPWLARHGHNVVIILQLANNA